MGYIKKQFRRISRGIKKLLKPVGKALKKTFRVPEKGEVRKTARRAFEPLKKTVKKLKHI